jgi:maltose alpha-D-glucosyltransferase/alpha-amylase
MGGTDDGLWYKDAIIYEAHVKSFYDGDGDGSGDFHGLTQKLDYLRYLGVDCIWLLPFFPSPLRDDGYDVTDYTNVHPAYGTLDDFRAFTREAHARGLRVITELVVNHTSDRHPWFQAARHAPKGSPERDVYVWSDTPDKFAGTRIIFCDSEPSNWTWDEQAKAYYWHRFFHHQPDLNLNNPAVVERVLGVMRFWLDLGVDGFRLDAAPYFCVREGTSNESVPETHEVIRAMRRFVDRHYPGRVLLAEANQQPIETSAYFGQGDECSMAYHFPLMPRMYLALAHEDRGPITDILARTPPIPSSCQWAIFLRNHDELTLEMLSEAERAAMYAAYAEEEHHRLNLGIRRRLAPLLWNCRRRRELLKGLLLSLPGSPVLYYGDEIGMGDDLGLDDRHGVRTPMQWSSGPNAGFSSAAPERLYSKPVDDPVFGYQAINVEAQIRDRSSLLNWMRRMIALRRTTRAFGRGDFAVLEPENRHVLAYVRSHEGESVLVVANLAASVQSVDLDLSHFAGRVPVEMTGGAPLPRIGREPYRLTLGTHGFYWLRLE